MSDYDKQAEEFLKRNKLQMTITQVPYTPPVWEDKENVGRRNKYNVGIHRPTTRENKDDPSYKQTIRFDFWGSIYGAERGLLPTSYDLLACISGDVHCPDTFEEFCSEYGYDEDSRKAEKTFRAANALAKKLRSFFSEEEMTELQEIQ